MILHEDFFDEIGNIVDVQNVTETGVYEMALSFSTNLGSRNIRLFVAHIPFENMFRRFMYVMKSCSFMTVDDFTDTIIVSNKENTYTSDFGKNFKDNAISEFITLYSDVFFHKSGVNATVNVTTIYKVKFVYESVNKRDYAKDCCSILNIISMIESNMKLLSKYQNSPSITIKPTLYKDFKSLVEYDEYLGSDNISYWKKFLTQSYKEIESETEENSVMLDNMISSKMNTKKYENIKVCDIDFLKKWMNDIIEKAKKNNLCDLVLVTYNRMFTKTMNAQNGCQVVLKDAYGHSIKEIAEGLLDIMESSLSWIIKLKLTEYASVDNKTIFVCLTLSKDDIDKFDISEGQYIKTFKIVDNGDFETTLRFLIALTDGHLNLLKSKYPSEYFKYCMRDAEIA